MELDYGLFETNQEYHDVIKNISTPYNSSYYDIYMKKYLENNIPNEFILVNYFTKLYCWTYGTDYSIEIAIKPLNRFSNITITNELFTKIIENINDPNKYAINYDNLELIYKGLSVFYNLIMICNYDITLNDLHDKLHLINLNNLGKLPNYYSAKKNLIPLIKKIFTIVYDKNPNYQINTNTFEYIFKFNLLDNYKIKNYDEYKLLYKYEKSIKKIKFYKNYNPNIDCLHNACDIKDNVTVVKNLLKSIEPDSICLTNSLKYIDNKIIYILLEKINPTTEQVIQYCELKKDFVTKLLVEKL